MCIHYLLHYFVICIIVANYLQNRWTKRRSWTNFPPFSLPPFLSYSSSPSLPSPWLPVYLSTCLPVYLSTCLPVAEHNCCKLFGRTGEQEGEAGRNFPLSLCLPFSLVLVLLSTLLPFLPVYLSTCLPVYLSTCLPVYLSQSIIVANYLAEPVNKKEKLDQLKKRPTKRPDWNDLMQVSSQGGGGVMT